MDIEPTHDRAGNEIPPQILAIIRLLKALSSGDFTELTTCIHCGEEIDELEQVGRSVYAHPCGHRQFQGFLQKKKHNTTTITIDTPIQTISHTITPDSAPLLLNKIIVFSMVALVILIFVVLAFNSGN